MSLALALLIAFFVLGLLAIVFVGMPNVKEIRWTEKREALMYKTAYWLVISAVVCIVLSLICFVKGY